MLDRYRTQEDYSWFKISDLLNCLDYKIPKQKKKIFYDVITCLNFLQSEKMIKILDNLDNINYDTGIKIKIIPENFDAVDNFTMIDFKTFDKIMNSRVNVSRENILLVFLYINSYIYIRKKDVNELEHFNDCKDRPEAFFRELKQVPKELGISHTTLISCINELVNQKILIKHIIGSLKDKNKDTPPKNIPNVYVLNKVGWQNEIKLAENKLKEMYQVERFNKFIQKKSN